MNVVQFFALLVMSGNVNYPPTTYEVYATRQQCEDAREDLWNKDPWYGGRVRWCISVPIRKD